MALLRVCTQGHSFPLSPDVFYASVNTATHCWLTDAEDLTEDSIAAFVASWDAGELGTKEFNLPARDDSGGEDEEVE